MGVWSEEGAFFLVGSALGDGPNPLRTFPVLPSKNRNMTDAEKIQHWMASAAQRGAALIAANARIVSLEAEVEDLKQKLSGAQADLAEQAVLQDPDPLAELSRAANRDAQAEGAR